MFVRVYGVEVRACQRDSLSGLLKHRPELFSPFRGNGAGDVLHIVKALVRHKLNALQPQFVKPRNYVFFALDTEVMGADKKLHHRA